LGSVAVTVYSQKFFEDWTSEFSPDDKYEKLKQYGIIAFAGGMAEGSITIVTGIIGYYLSIRIHSKMLFSVLHSQF